VSATRESNERADQTDGAALTADAADAALQIAGKAEAPAEPSPLVPADGLSAADPAVRAAAYERLIRLEASPAELTGYLRSGLADVDPRVRRRVVLAASARRVAPHSLLDPLRGDPDAQVRRVVREVLRHMPEPEQDSRDAEEKAVVSSPGSP
jgi:hypothetical protein